MRLVKSTPIENSNRRLFFEADRTTQFGVHYSTLNRAAKLFEDDAERKTSQRLANRDTKLRRRSLNDQMKCTRMGATESK